MKARIFLLALALAGGAPAWAAVVHLKDGTQVRGTVVSATSQDVQVQTDDGARRIDAADILRIDYAGAEPAPAARPVAPLERPVERPFERPLSTAYDQNTFTLDLGLAAPLSRVGPSDTGGSAVRNGGLGVSIGAQYLRAFGQRLDAGVEAGFSSRNEVHTDSLVPFTASLTSGGTFAPLAVLKYGFGDRDLSVRPYVLAGAGPNLTNTVIDAQPLYGYVWADTGTDEPRRLMDDSRWGLAARAAFGLDFHPWAPVVTGFEIGWLGVFNGRSQATPAGRQVGLENVTGKLNQLIIRGHWGWRF